MKVDFSKQYKDIIDAAVRGAIKMERERCAKVAAECLNNRGMPGMGRIVSAEILKDKR